MVGDRWSERSHEIKTFLARNHVPYAWYDIERDPEGMRLLTLAQAGKADLPLVMIPEASTLRGPTTLSLAAALGLRTQADSPCTTCASSEVGRQDWPRPSTRRPRGCRP